MYALYFSPKSTTKKIALAAAGAWGTITEVDLLKKPLKEALAIPAGEAVLVALPVYAGRIPALCREMLGRLEGAGNPAVAVVAYGNRDYDDALLELVEVLEAQNFRVVAAGAFIGQHSIFTSVAAGRPDGADLAALAAFGARARAAAESAGTGAVSTPAVKGDPAYGLRPARRVAIKPDGNKNCTKCRACVARCPVGAISADDPRATDGDRCISCGACIYICPVEARGYHGEGFAKGEADFAAKCGARREPEVFFGTEAGL